MEKEHIAQGTSPVRVANLIRKLALELMPLQMTTNRGEFFSKLKLRVDRQPVRCQCADDPKPVRCQWEINTGQTLSLDAHYWILKHEKLRLREMVDQASWPRDFFFSHSPLNFSGVRSGFLTLLVPVSTVVVSYSGVLEQYVDALCTSLNTGTSRYQL